MTATTTEIYRRLLSEPSAGYGYGDHWKPVLQLLRDDSPSSLLDVGCGRGELAMAMRSPACETRSCDIAPCSPCIDQAELPVLPYNNGQFDIVCCFDVLEHLPEYQIGAAIDELRRVGRRHLIVSVAECSDVRDVPGLGPIELHLTRQPVDWWRSQFGFARIIEAPGQPSWRHYLAVPV